MLCVVRRSERQPALAGAVGEGGDPAVVLVAAAVEDHAPRHRRPWPARRRARRPCVALAVLSPSSARRSASMVRPRPACGRRGRRRPGRTMCRAERVTTRRGRSAVPVTFLRPRTWRRSRDAARARVCLPGLSAIAMSLTSLSDLAADVLAGVPHALALVRARACAACGCWRRPRRPAACRCPGRANRVGLSTVKVMPSGALTVTGWLIAELRTRAASGPWQRRGSRRRRSRASSRSPR